MSLEKSKGYHNFVRVTDLDNISSVSVRSISKLGQIYPIECTLHLCLREFSSSWISL